ncbi:hypothetical protein P3L10_025976 [Capsicum annuum]
MQDILDDAFGIFDDNNFQDSGPSNLSDNDHPWSVVGQSQEERDKIKELLKDGNQELYVGCAKYSKLPFIVHLYHIKVLCGTTDKTFSMTLDLLKNAFPHAKLPSSFYESKNMIKRLGLSYDKIDACLNHCMIYWGSPEDMNRDKCKKCNISRYIPDENNLGTNVEIDDQHKRKLKPAKVLRDTRNVRFALAMDGFNPFGNLSSNVIIWPVMLYIYNYPPWCFMKQTSLIMSMIIPGPKMTNTSIGEVTMQKMQVDRVWNLEKNKKVMVKLNGDGQESDNGSNLLKK